VITAQPDHKDACTTSRGEGIFVSKPFDLRKYCSGVPLLEVRLLHLEMKKLYSQVVEEQKSFGKAFAECAASCPLRTVKRALKVTVGRFYRSHCR